MAMKIYTKTGDAGKTSLIGGTRVLKSDLRIDAYGTIDELNSYLGVVSSQYGEEETKTFIKEIQDRLFTIGSELACDPDKKIKMVLPDLYEADVELLEKRIDEMDTQLPVMKHFILPGGSEVVSFIHVARCVCRRAERKCIGLQQHSTVDPLIIKYLNRLSDYLFMLGRYKAMQNKDEEIIWLPRIQK